MVDNGNDRGHENYNLHPDVQLMNNLAEFWKINLELIN